MKMDNTFWKVLSLNEQESPIQRNVLSCPKKHNTKTEHMYGYSEVKDRYK
jgi:hypothetical protein